MNFHITEQQLKTIILEGSNDKFTNYMKEMSSFMNNLVQKVKKRYSLNAKLLLTWGAALGGLMMPLDNYINNKGFDVTDSQKALILVGVAAAIFYENKKYFDRIFEEIKKDGLSDVFKDVLLKGVSLRNAFIKFIKSLSVSINTASEIISYAFLVPIISDIINYLNSGDAEKNLILILKRITASGIATIVPEILREILRKIIKRFSN